MALALTGGLELDEYWRNVRNHFNTMYRDAGFEVTVRPITVKDSEMLADYRKGNWSVTKVSESQVEFAVPTGRPLDIPATTALNILDTAQMLFKDTDDPPDVGD